MALALTSLNVNRNLRTKVLLVKATPTGNYSTTGDTLNLNLVTAPVGMADATVGYPGKIVEYEVVYAPAGYTAQLIPGATPATWKLKASTSAGVELSAAAYPAAVLADAFTLRFVGPKMQL